MKKRELSGVRNQRDSSPDKQGASILRLIKAGADIHQTDKNGVTLLHHAVRFRSPAAVEALLRLGAAVNQICKRSGSTPLHRAVTSTGAPGTAGKSAEARQIVELLLRYGADASIKNKSGKAPADYVREPELRLLLKSKRTGGPRSLRA